jgi:hypothetical protein
MEMTSRLLQFYHSRSPCIKGGVYWEKEEKAFSKATPDGSWEEPGLEKSSFPF